ncbi:MAG: 4Fe-4S ferredoxin, partial [Thermodesulfobacteriota bacterium]
DTPIVGDIGVLCSSDPVAIDQASADLVNAQPGNEGSRLHTHLGPGEDKFRALYPQIDWGVQLQYAEEIGLGSRRYDLFPI